MKSRKKIKSYISGLVLTKKEVKKIKKNTLNLRGSKILKINKELFLSNKSKENNLIKILLKRKEINEILCFLLKKKKVIPENVFLLRNLVKLNITVFEEEKKKRLRDDFLKEEEFFS
ncbi:SsrA-binding protein [Candidatus Vidania fulgoroideae]|nr:SsrA-binding protein [Candidatus Vidania fulgoroideae]